MIRSSMASSATLQVQSPVTNKSVSVMHICNPRTPEVEVGGSGVQGHSGYIGSLIGSVRPRPPQKK